MGPSEFLPRLIGEMPLGYGVELRRVPGAGHFAPPELHRDPPDLGVSTYHFSVLPRRLTDNVIDTGNLVWVDTDSSPIEVNWVVPAPTAMVWSGSTTLIGVAGQQKAQKHYHLYWRLRDYQEPDVCTRLSILATVAYMGDFACCEPRRVMRVPGSFNSKKKPGQLAEVVALDESLSYEVQDLEERLVAAVFRPSYLVDERRHELALNIGGILARAGWDVQRSLRAMNHLYDLAPGQDRDGKLEAIRTTFQRKEKGEPIASRLVREVLGDTSYDKLLLGLGITSRDGDLIVGGEVVGTKVHIERDLANYLLAGGDWRAADGQVVRWKETHWEAIPPEVLRAEVFKLQAATTLVAKGEEVPLVAKAALAGAITSILTGRLLDDPLPEPNPLELSLANGVLNIEARELREHRRDQWQRSTLDFPYDPAAQCPRWEAFVRWAAPQEGLADFLQEWMGYCLLTENPWQRMLWLFGPSGTGKSTFIKVLTRLLGESVTAVSTEKFSEYSVAQLAGKRVATASELSPRTLKTSTLKALIAGDLVQARHPYGRPFDVQFRGKLVWSSNGLPPLDQAEGMRRRINVVEFKQLPAVVDEQLEYELYAEMPGVLNWALEGVSRLLSLRGSSSGQWALPPSVQAFVNEYMEAADPLQQFFQEEVVLEEDVEFAAIEVYQRYVEWAKDRGVFVESWGPGFYRGMRQYGLEPSENSKAVGKRMIRMWKGGRLVAGIFGVASER